jgi:signal peptidase I
MMIPGFLVEITEKILTYRKRKRSRKAEKEKKKHAVREWAEVIVFSLLVVLIVQNLLFELYVIPTGSMIPTIDTGTRAVMDKTAFGPELIREVFGLGAFRKPVRGEVIMFLNPDPGLKPMGPMERMLHKIVFLATLTLVDIDRDEHGNPRVRLLLKRTIGEGGDRIRFRHGNVELLLKGGRDWITEESAKESFGLKYPVRRTLDSTRDDDYFSLERNALRLSREQEPQNRVKQDLYRKKELGFYIPPDSFFPMGDNRDNSRDARVYGPVGLDNLLGKAVIRVWPPNRFGLIE